MVCLFLTGHLCAQEGDDISVNGLNITDLGNNDGWLFNNSPIVTAPSSISQLTNGSGYISFQTTSFLQRHLRP